MDVKKVGGAIRYLRLKEGYTQQDLADIMGISFQAVSKWERGLCMPDAMYLSQLAELLNVDLEDLLDGNITYLDEEWRGLLILTNVQSFDSGEIMQMCDIFLSYFMLAGIRKITIQADSCILKDLKMKYQQGKDWGIEIIYMTSAEKFKICCNVMILTDPIFLYGTNLTKYFWRAMARKDSVSILTAELGKKKNEIRVLYDKQNIIKSFNEGDNYVLPIIFVPRGFSHICKQQIPKLIKMKQLYAEPTARGLISKRIRSKNDWKEILQLKTMIESMTEEMMYDMNEISRVRRLNRTDY